MPGLLRTWCVAIARYNLHRFDPPDYVVRDAKAAETSLAQMARGIIDLPVSEGETPPAAGQTGNVSIVGPEPVFTREKLEGWL